MRRFALVRATTLWRLGLHNVIRVAIYRLLGRLGVYARLLPLGEAYAGPFFLTENGADSLSAPPVQDTEGSLFVARAERVLSGEIPFFGFNWVRTGFPPFRPSPQPKHWSRVNEFAAGDIKLAWEPSRFDGLLFLAQAFCCTREERFLSACNTWLGRWVESNPWNSGENWKCAQEAALRMMSVIVASDLLARYGGVRATPALFRFISEHARRIRPTMLYAVAQDNNHGTSEAAALYIAGLFCLRADRHSANAMTWRNAGRRHMEARVRRLVMADGSFAQHSVNYHRLMLDTVSLAEHWRQREGDVAFSCVFERRMQAAVRWLDAMVDEQTGDAPNLGANDGARFMPLSLADYRDYRPTIAFASAVFGPHQRYSGSDANCRWLSQETRAVAAEERDWTMTEFPDGGYLIVRLQHGKLMVRLPRYRFRPSQADGLHLDLWWKGKNLLRDAGSYSYNTKSDASLYFAETIGHNTIEMDGRSQMPRLGRFLYGAWLRGQWRSEALPEGCRIEAWYSDYLGAEHRRVVTVRGRGIEIQDEAYGFTERAVLRWRLAPKTALAGSAQVVGDGFMLAVRSAGGAACRTRLVEGAESRHYGEREAIPVLETELLLPQKVVTEIQLV